MKILLGWISLSFPILIILISQTQSHATQIDDPRPIDKWKISQLTKFQGHNSVLVGVLCFIAASISSAAGVGGGGLYIPILTIVAGLDLKTASSFTAYLVTGGSIANVLYNLHAELNDSKKTKTTPMSLIDYDIALLSVPCMLLGVSVGVICNLAFPEWFVTILFAIFLGWSTFKTFGNGVRFWKKETQSQTRNNNEKLENESSGGETSSSLEEPLMVGKDTEGKELERYPYPWKKLVVLIVIWSSFSAIYILRGDQFGHVKLLPTL